MLAGICALFVGISPKGVRDSDSVPCLCLIHSAALSPL